MRTLFCTIAWFSNPPANVSPKRNDTRRLDQYEIRQVTRIDMADLVLPSFGKRLSHWQHRSSYMEKLNYSPRVRPQWGRENPTTSETGSNSHILVEHCA